MVHVIVSGPIIPGSVRELRSNRPVFCYTSGMASKVERLRARLKNYREGAERLGKNVLHSAETLVVAGGGAYAEGRMSGDDGEWGFKGVPYLYVGGALLMLGGVFAGDKYSEDLFALGTGAVSGHLSRTMYESGINAKQNRTTGGRTLGRRSVPQALHQKQPNVRKTYGSVFDNVPVGA